MWQDEHILITGSAVRVGLAMSAFFEALGARVSRHHHAQPGAPNSFQADLGQAEECHSLVAEVVRERGPLSMLIHNASIFSATPIESCRPKDWDRFLKINLASTRALTDAFLVQLTGPGALLFVIDSFVEHGLPHHAPYATAKTAQLGLMEALVKEHGPRLRVNAVSPGLILFPPDYSAVKKQRLINKVPLGMGAPQDICEAAKFLLANRYCNGICLPVNGGL